MNKLTCIITFKNEGKEVENTVKSIRETTDNDVDIILVDDCSDDETNYNDVAIKYNCSYVKTPQRFGVAGSRDFGVVLCRTPYFVLLDGHMRFYQKNWNIKLVDALEKNPNSIITSTSVCMWLNDDGTIDNEDGMNDRIPDDEWGTSWPLTSHACYINLVEDNHEFTSAWATKSKDDDPNLIEVPSVMGAVYASSVEHWNYIKGLYMLRSYGNDEAFMAMKTWLLGGKCLLLRKFGVGHLYRSKMPYNGYDFVDYTFNRVLLAELFCDEETQDLYNRTYEHAKNILGEQGYNKLLKIFEDNKNEINEYKQYINEHKKMSLTEFINNVNSYATP